jgi:F0F1-type ATP synthase epsilon subunit
MKFSLISIKKKILDTEKIESVSVPTKDGTITILPNHEPLISALKPGILMVKLAD